MTEVLSMQSHRRFWLTSGGSLVVYWRPFQAPIASASKTCERLLMEPCPVAICLPFW